MATYGILGPIELRAGDRRVPAGGPRQLALLAYLLLHANRAVSNDQLQDALWGDDGAGALKAVQMAVARLRKTLEPLQPVPALRTVSGGYLLTVAPGELDAEAFEAGVAQGRARLGAGDPAGASDAFHAALALWRGPPLAEVAFADFARSEIKRLEELRLGALESRIDADLALGRHAALVGELEQLSAEHPERERTCAQLMLALYRAGRAGDALEAYHRIGTHLAAELGLAPGPALQALHRAIVEQSPSLRLEPSGAVAAVDVPAFALPPAVTAGARAAFVGRDDAVDALTAVFEQASSGARRFVMLSGEPGIGKTRLATELGLRAHSRGAIVLYGRCDEDPLQPHQPFVEALRHYICNADPTVIAGQVQLISGELRRVVPELAERVPGLAHPLSGDPAGARYRLFEAVAGLLCEAAQHRPLVLVLDDLHWADDATLLLLKYVARYPREARLMIVGTFRDMDVEPGHRLHGLLADLAREQVFERIALRGLDERAVAELVGLHTADRASPELGRRVFEETEGHAFFVVEVLRHLAETGASPEIGERRLPLPEAVRTLIGRRLARLGRETTRVLGTASVLGRAFDFDRLERLCDLGQDALVDALDRAVAAQIVEESSTTVGLYSFAHALTRDVIHGTLTPTRRALLHRRAATAIEEANAADLEPVLAELASHFEQAGSPSDLEQAIAYGARAGDRAIAVLAYEQAAAHYGHTLDLLGAGGSPELRCDLTIARGEAERMAGNAAYRETLLDGARIALTLGDVDRLARAAMANNRGSSSSSQGVDHARVAVLEAALEGLGEVDSETRAVLLVQLAVELIADPDSRRRARLGDEALAMARRIGDPRTLARVLTMRSLAKWSARTVADRSDDLLEAFGLASSVGERLLAGYAAYLGSDAAVEAGDLGRAAELLASLGSLAAELGQPIIEWYAAIARAKRCCVCSSPREAERLAFVAFDVGQRGGQPDALIWFLGQIFVARFLQGTLDGTDPDMPALFETPGSSPVVGPEFTPGRSVPLLVSAASSLMFCELGRLADARRHLALLEEDLANLPQDYSTLPILSWASRTCAGLGDTALATQLRSLLEPYDGQFVNTGGSWFGAVGHHLAVLDALLGHMERAKERFAAAERAYEDLGARAWLARCRLDWAHALLTCNGVLAHGLDARAAALLDGVLVDAGELDLPRVAARAEALRAEAACS
jgi:DNA-binding SARP family transcriptional activator